jgi:hypothetical protein
MRLQLASKDPKVPRRALPMVLAGAAVVAWWVTGGARRRMKALGRRAAIRDVAVPTVTSNRSTRLAAWEVRARAAVLLVGPPAGPTRRAWTSLNGTGLDLGRKRSHVPEMVARGSATGVQQPSACELRKRRARGTT